MGHYPRLALLRRVIRCFGNQLLFQYIENKKILSQKDINFLRSVDAIVRKEFVKIKRYSGDPYVSHLYATMAILVVYCDMVEDAELLAATLLHDIMEEFPQKWDRERVCRLSSVRTADIVAACTVDRNLYYYDYEAERKEFYFRGIKDQFDFAAVKIADRLHNQLTLSFCDKEQQQRKNEETKKYVLPLSEHHDFLFEELRQSTLETDERLYLMLTP
ncbi:MAG: bifunctional (p)ppGpp synthetase/guanosine-3',5'-bis(diphosphate) 3'-pyrophosphohydrolase [Candidatus Moranbacteria bacterium]|nr:bifunctional (p)ppGpp synthetase/guanosine-3',5'-bis(diphosphate) 3'-pyrophosphohydrolase [Candidatus Moranbacteria bacterium]